MPGDKPLGTYPSMPALSWHEFPMVSRHTKPSANARLNGDSPKRQAQFDVLARHLLDERRAATHFVSPVVSFELFNFSSSRGIHMQVKNFIAAAAVAALGLGAVSANAAVATGQFTVSLTVNSTCAVNTGSGSNITLAAVNAGGTTTIGSGAFTVNCSNGTAYNVGLAPSSGNTDGTGNLKSGSNTIAYALYQNATGATAWGNTVTSSSVGNGQSGTGTGMGTTKAKLFTVYANATGTTDVPPATYSDTVTVNVNY